MLHLAVPGSCLEPASLEDFSTLKNSMSGVAGMRTGDLWSHRASAQIVCAKQQIFHGTERWRGSEGWHGECSGYCGCLLGWHCQGPSGLAATWAPKLNPVFHIFHIKLCPPEPSVLSGAVKDTFQPLWATPSLPQAVSAQRCCHFTPWLRFRMKQPSPPLSFLVAIQWCTFQYPFPLFFI